MDDWNNPYLRKLRSISIGDSGLREEVTDTYYYDKKVIEQGLQSADPNERDQAKKAGERIRKTNVNKTIMKLRKDLVGLHRKGDKGGIEEIHKVIKKNE